jgi:hypothetical protein
MRRTLFAILTNEQIRSSGAVEATLDKEFKLGVPWFN